MSGARGGRRGRATKGGKPPQRGQAGAWLQFVIALTLYGVLWGILVASLPLTLGLGLVVDLLRGERRLPFPRLILVLGCYLSCELVGAVVAIVIPLFGGWRERDGWSPYLERNFRLQLAWGTVIQRLVFKIYGMRLEVETDYDFSAGRPIVLLMRHTSVADTILAVVCVSKRFGTRLRYVLKRELLWDPCLNIVGRRLPNYFVDRSHRNPVAEVHAVGRLASGLVSGEGVLIYPEGTRFTPAKQKRIREKLANSKSQDAREWAARYQHVLPPRPGGTLRILREAPHADIVFGGHTGFEGARTLASLWRGDLIHRRVKVRFWTVDRSLIPEVPAARRRWMYEEWGKMDAFVAGSLDV